MSRSPRDRSALETVVDDAMARIGDVLPDHSEVPFALNQAIAAGLTAAASHAIRKWAGRRRPSMGRLLRGALAGAGAAAITAGVRTVWGDRSDSAEFADALLLGAGKGLVYTALLDPVLPGPPALRGTVAGLTDYMAAPWGGLMSRLGPLTPADKLPVVGALLEAGDREEDPLVSYLIYGFALGLLAGDDSAR